MDRNRAEVLCLCPGRRGKRLWLQTGHTCVKETANKSVFEDVKKVLGSKASDVLSNDYSDTGSEEEQTDVTHSSSYAEEAGESDLTSTSDSGTENAKRKAVKLALDVKPLDRKKRIRRP